MRRELIQQVRAELGPRAALPAAASQYLAAAVADFVLGCQPSRESLRREFRADRQAILERILPLASAWSRRQIPDLLAALRSAGIPLSADCPLSAFSQPPYSERVLHLALERLLVNPAAPPLLVSPVCEPTFADHLQDRPVVAVLFDYPLAITHELYPLWTDACVFSLNAPVATPSFELVGVHTSWLDADCRARRAILFDADLDLFLEGPLSAPLPLSAALLLCQSRETHRTLATRLADAAIPHVNPYPGVAELADDKWRCFVRWAESGVATPPTCLLSREESRESALQAIGDFAGQHRGSGWVIQPRHGTEGAQVNWVEEGAMAPERLLGIWREIAAEDDAILRPRVGLVHLPSADGPLPFDLRLHVAFDGTRYQAESGYLLVAPAADAPITSIARGGQIRSFSCLNDANLVNAATSPLAAVSWRNEDFAAVEELAIRSVRAFGDLELAGVDIKLDFHAGRLAPSLLDLNPRPAGLLHANLFASGEAGIASGLWRRIASSVLAQEG